MNFLDPTNGNMGIVCAEVNIAQLRLIIMES